MSALVHAVVAGPTLKKSTPAATTSPSASAPNGVVPPRGGPFASTIGNTFAPFKSTVPRGLRPVVVALAADTNKPPTMTARAKTASLVPGESLETSRPSNPVAPCEYHDATTQ